jgi:polyhydroxyalkanoate synthesis regulator phasin
MDNTKKNKMNIIEFLTSAQFIILIITVIGASVVAISTYKDGKIRDEINQGIKKIDTIVNNSEIKLNESAKKLSENLEETKNANEKLKKTYKNTVENLAKTIEAKNATIESQTEILGQITGGDSYPAISLKNDGFYISVKGAYSIPNLKVQINAIANLAVYPEINIKRDTDINKLKEKIFNLHYGKLWKTTPFAEFIPFKNINEFLNKTENHIHGFDIIFNSDYKKWKQYIRIISHKGRWEIEDVLVEIQTTQVTGMQSDKFVYTHVSELFPINSKEIYKYFSSNDLSFLIEYNAENGIGSLPLDYFEKK